MKAYETLGVDYQDLCDPYWVRIVNTMPLHASSNHAFADFVCIRVLRAVGGR